MDLSFRPFLIDRELAVSPGELAVLVATASATQHATFTAQVQAILDLPCPLPNRFAPVTGSFDAAVAAALWRWRRSEIGQ